MTSSGKRDLGVRVIKVQRAPATFVNDGTDIAPSGVPMRRPVDSNSPSWSGPGAEGEVRGAGAHSVSRTL